MRAEAFAQLKRKTQGELLSHLPPLVGTMDLRDAPSW